jgi:YesN/AraC family two-component response regulator
MKKTAADLPPSKRFCVLIADDSEAIRQSLSALISRVNNVEIVGLARTGSEALELIRTLKPDAVTLDIRMPELNGMHVLEGIKREGLEVMPIMMTGVTEDEYRRKCMELGAKYFFHKSTEFERLINVLTEHAAQRQNPPGRQTSGLD